MLPNTKVPQSYKWRLEHWQSRKQQNESAGLFREPERAHENEILLCQVLWWNNIQLNNYL